MFVVLLYKTPCAYTPMASPPGQIQLEERRALALARRGRSGDQEQAPYLEQGEEQALSDEVVPCRAQGL